MNNDKQAADGNQSENAHEEMIPEGKVETIVDAPADTGLSELEAALAEAMADLEKHKDALLRQQAEVQNSRTRAAREIDKARKFALDGFMKELLPVHDTFARGLEAENATAETLREGSELTLKMFSKALEKFGLESVNPEGEVFNPDFHEAVGMVPMEGYESGSVIEVIQKGYKLNDRLVRAAMVIVAQ
ncbi:MAG: nucleotide exchange factor GrpE [Proteobacteria bacterium]|nr:nucleotide exchange factor GrpE [Pseudomonadota bacterium]